MNICIDCDKGITKSATRCLVCSNKHRRAEKSARFQTGRYVGKNGYVYLTGMQGHPNAKRNSEIAEHTWIMSQVLGRPLVIGESVHHINGVKDDNRPENLELWCKPQPIGIRSEDAVNWAVELLNRYQPDVLKAEYQNKACQSEALTNDSL